MRRCDSGAIAQLGERYNGIVEVGGSIPPGSTSFLSRPHRLVGLGHRPFTPATGVRIPLGTPFDTDRPVSNARRFDDDCPVARQRACDGVTAALPSAAPPPGSGVTPRPTACGILATCVQWPTPSRWRTPCSGRCWRCCCAYPSCPPSLTTTTAGSRTVPRLLSPRRRVRLLQGPPWAVAGMIAKPPSRRTATMPRPPALNAPICVLPARVVRSITRPPCAIGSLCRDRCHPDLITRLPSSGPLEAAEPPTDPTPRSAVAPGSRDGRAVHVRRVPAWQARRFRVWWLPMPAPGEGSRANIPRHPGRIGG